MRRILLIVPLLLIGCQHHEQQTPTPPPIQEPKPKQEPKPPTTIQILLQLHNEQRGLKGRPPLEIDTYLNKYAQNHADWMERKNRLQHSDISTLMGRYVAAGENIAWNQQDEQEVVRAWMHSPGHRANIMNRNFTKIGFGLATGPNGPYWCAVFGG